MSWIQTISYESSQGRLRKTYDRIKGPDDYIDNILQLHSLRPHTLDGHMHLYKNVLHHSANTIPKWFLETIGIYVSWLNGCEYCVEHHYAGLKRLLDDDERASQLRGALEGQELSRTFDAREQAILTYTRKLTETPAVMEEADIGRLHDSGITDGEILEINQVVAYFAYANRTVQGLGCTTVGDVLGMSPADSDHPDNWQHI